VERALSKLADIQRIASTPEGRMEIRSMLDGLGIRIGLGFVGAIKGKKRPVRKLAGGIIVFGDEELPVKLHGKDRLDEVDGQHDGRHDEFGDDGPGDDGPGDVGPGDVGRGDPDGGYGYADGGTGSEDTGRVGESPERYFIGTEEARIASPAFADNEIIEGEIPPSERDVFSSKCHQEEVSFTKVNRADWIRTSDLLTPSARIG
jgi:hypothetical protein